MKKRILNFSDGVDEKLQKLKSELNIPLNKIIVMIINERIEELNILKKEKYPDNPVCFSYYGDTDNPHVHCDLRIQDINRIDLKHKIDETLKRISELKEEKLVFINQFKDTKYQELLTLKKEARNLQSEINAINFKNQKQSIVSPFAKLMINTVGGVVTPAEKLISIVPKDSPLIVKANVLNQDIGFIKNEMNSKIKIDTFNFQKYGFFEGKVINVGSYSIKDEKLGDIYEVKIEPNGKKLLLEGKERYLEAGMSITAEIKVGKR